MISHSTYQSLLKESSALTSELENNPVFKQLQLVKQLIESYEGENKLSAAIRKPPTVKTPQPPSDGASMSDEEIQAVVDNGINFWVDNGNKSVKSGRLKDHLANQGVTIKGKSPGTTVGAIISQRRGIFELADEKKRLWRLTKEAYEAAKRKTADARSAA